MRPGLMQARKVAMPPVSTGSGVTAREQPPFLNAEEPTEEPTTNRGTQTRVRIVALAFVLLGGPLLWGVLGTEKPDNTFVPISGTHGTALSNNNSDQGNGGRVAHMSPDVCSLCQSFTKRRHDVPVAEQSLQEKEEEQAALSCTIEHWPHIRAGLQGPSPLCGSNGATDRASSGNLSIVKHTAAFLDHITNSRNAHKYRTEELRRTLQKPKSLAQSRKAVLAALARKQRHEQSHDMEIPDAWVDQLCPEVVSFYADVPNGLDTYTEPTDSKGPAPIPFLTIRTARAMTCLYRVFAQCAERTNTEWRVWAGSHLGSVSMGTLMPWDDDADVLIPHESMETVEACLKTYTIQPPSGSHTPSTHFEVIWETRVKATMKLSIVGSPRAGRQPWGYPFLDIWGYSYDEKAKRLRETSYTEKTKWFDKSALVRRPILMGGLVVPGPSVATSHSLYHLEQVKGHFRCITHFYNHRLERHSPIGDMDCCELTKYFSFVRRVAVPAADIVYEVGVLRNQEIVTVTSVCANTGAVTGIWRAHNCSLQSERVSDVVHSDMCHLTPVNTRWVHSDQHMEHVTFDAVPETNR